jgi:Response regulator of the LytR/AlgR family
VGRKKMVKIALIDDESAVLESIRRCVENEITPEDESVLSVYTCGEDFLRRMHQGEEYDILVSDIDMPKMGGMELGRRIRGEGSRIYLVYLTAHLEYAAESYIIEAYQYILKEDMEKRLPPILRQLIDRVKREKRQFRMIGTPTSKVQIYYRDILYVEKEKGTKYIRYTTVCGTYKERISLKQLIVELVSDEFILVERGYIINVTHIASMKNGIIKMDNNTEILVNRTNFKKIQEQISLYRGNL